MSPNTSKDISVQADGIKIGWNIMAALAAMGIGMYVYIIITPLKADIASIKTSVVKIARDDAYTRIKVDDLENVMDDRLDSFETKGALIEQRLNSLEGSK